MKLVRLQAGLVVVASGLSCISLAAPKKDLLVSVVVSAEKGVSELERVRVDRAIAIALAKARCAVRLASPMETANIQTTLRLQGWRESDVPGGEPVLDMQTGQDRPGHMREIEVQFTLDVSAVGEREPREAHQRRFVVSRGTNRIAAYDPAVASRELALTRLTDDLRGSVCGVAKSLRRAAKDDAR